MAREKDSIASSDEHNSRGIELADRGWLDEALKEFKKAIELDPESAHAWDNLATVYAEKQRYREALDAHLKSLQLDPENPSGHYNLASFLAAHGLDFAVSEFLQTIELEDDYPDAHLNLGLAYAELGRTEEALKALQTAVEFDPADAVPRYELASLQMEEGDFRHAIVQLKEVTRLDPRNFEGWLDLGICYAQKGFYEEAERAYEAARELKPDELLLRYNLSALYALWKKKAQSLEHLKAALELDRGKVSGWLRSDPMFQSLEGDADFEALR